MEKGLTEDKIAQLDEAENGYTRREQLALQYAELMAQNHHAIDDAFFAELHEVFNDPEILELGMMIGQYIGFGRLLKVLDLEPKYCAT
ncbi:MAG: hypothetical protein P8L31_07085 [Pseudomonadales bacterium]|jgi:alkylhydroperoxidase family enzyme|nr:hypothetical protein [Pseudomonadales bacterium]